MSGPYARTAWVYWAAGWRGVVPVGGGKLAKWPPARGYTGWAGVDPSGADVQTWVDGSEGAGNLGLRLPFGVYGLDVDDYAGKSGGAALGRLIERLGPIPPTWITSSRDDTYSGIRLYRAELSPGRVWLGEPAGHGAGVEAIHRGHRYAVAWPSIHPQTGRKYVWRRPDGSLAADGEVPRPDALPELPAAWVHALSEEGEARTSAMAGHEEALAAVAAWPEGEPCTRMREACARMREAMAAARAGAPLHPASTVVTRELVALGHEGHPGARVALAEHYGAHVAVRDARGERAAGEAEWWRLVRGAVGKLTGPGREGCDCALLGGEGVQFDLGSEGATEGDGDDASGGEGEVGGPEVPYVETLLGRMLTAAQVRDLAPPAPLVEGLLTLDSESWLIARSGAGKTFVALDLAGHVGTGRAWMGRAVARGPAVYLAAEGAGGMGPRVRAWEQRNGPMTGVSFLPVPVQVRAGEQWAALVEACRRLAPVLIVIDTQARVTVGLNENDNSEMGEFVEAVGRLRRACGACVLVVHHLGRSGGDARGASAIDGAQDTELKITKTAERRIVLETDKQRHLPDNVRIELELFPAVLDGGGTSLVVGPALNGVSAGPDWSVNLPLNQATLAQVMRDIFPMVGATKAELKSEVLRRPRRAVDGTVAEPMGDSAFRRAWDALVDGGRFVRVHGVQRYVIEDPTESEQGETGK